MATRVVRKVLSKYKVSNMGSKRYPHVIVLEDGEYTDEYKFCSACMLFHPLEDFNKNKNTWDGLTSRCLTCTETYHRKYYKRQQPEEVGYVCNPEVEEPSTPEKFKGKDLYTLAEQTFGADIEFVDYQITIEEE